jgi:molybdopterin converting factor small subunit
MKITAVFNGILANYIGMKRAEFDLTAGAKYADLLNAIGHNYGEKMPEQLWNKKQVKFEAAILATRDARRLNPFKLGTPLKEGDEINFFISLAGG